MQRVVTRHQDITSNIEELGIDAYISGFRSICGHHHMKCLVAHSCNLLCVNRKLFAANLDYLSTKMETWKATEVASEMAAQPLCSWSRDLRNV